MRGGAEEFLAVPFHQRRRASRGIDVLDEVLLEFHEPVHAPRDQVALADVAVELHIYRADDRGGLAEAVMVAEILDLEFCVREQLLVVGLGLGLLLLHREIRCGGCPRDFLPRIGLHRGQLLEERLRAERADCVREFFERGLGGIRCGVGAREVGGETLKSPVLLKVSRDERAVVGDPRIFAGGDGALEALHEGDAAFKVTVVPVLQPGDEEHERLVICAAELVPLRLVLRFARGDLRELAEKGDKLGIKAGYGRRHALGEHLEFRAARAGTPREKFRQPAVGRCPTVLRLRQEAALVQRGKGLRRLGEPLLDELPASDVEAHLRGKLRLGSFTGGGFFPTRADRLRPVEPEIKRDADDHRDDRKRHPASVLHAFAEPQHFRPAAFHGMLFPLHERVIEGLDEVRVAAETILRLKAQRPVNRVRRRLGDVRGVVQQAHGRALDPEQLGHRARLRDERRTPRDRVEKRRRERIHVAAEILRLAGEFLRRDVVRRGPHRALLLVLLLHEDREAEVHNLRHLPVGKKHVARFDVAVDEAALQPRLQARGDLDADGERLLLGYHLHLRHERLEAAVLDDFHR